MFRENSFKIFKFLCSRVSCCLCIPTYFYLKVTLKNISKNPKDMKKGKTHIKANNRSAISRRDSLFEIPCIRNCIVRRQCKNTQLNISLL